MKLKSKYDTQGRIKTKPEPTIKTPTNIWIESAVCTVSKIGTQAIRLKMRDELRLEHPELAKDIESQPWYLDPETKEAGDDYATFSWEWMGEDQIIMCWNSYMPLYFLPRLKKLGMTLGPVKQYGIPGVDDEGESGCVDYEFNMKASWAFSVLSQAGMIPEDSKFMNEDECPLSYCPEENEDGSEDDEEVVA